MVVEGKALVSAAAAASVAKDGVGGVEEAAGDLTTDVFAFELAAGMLAAWTVFCFLAS